MKVHSGVDTDSRMTRTRGTSAANVSYITQAQALRHDDETMVLGVQAAEVLRSANKMTTAR